MKTIYRIENPQSKHGMWYNENAELDPIIQTLCPTSKSKDLPMDYNEKHRKDGKVWNSAGRSIEEMNYWFSKEDAINLCNNGFKLFEFVVTEYQELEHEILFTREGVISQKEIHIDLVWN